MTERCSLILALCLVLAPAWASAEIYRWVDAEGRVHFGERPAGAGAERVEVRPQVVESDAAARERQQAAGKYFDARREERQISDQQAQERREKQEKECKALRDELSYIQRHGVFYDTDEAGKRMYYSDEQMKANRQRLAEQIEQRCR